MRHFGLIGAKLGHSFSKGFFTDLFTKQEIQADYSNFELTAIDEVQPLLDGRLSGFNVTIPYKEAILPYLDELSEEAKQIGAVNTVKISNGKSIGYNTDAFGFHQSIKPFLTNQHERALIFGTGGASKAVAFIFKQIGLDVLYVSRGEKGGNVFGYEDVNEHMLRACKVIVNTTPVGMYPNVDDLLPLPYEALTEDHLVIDLIYNPEETAFLSRAKAAGAVTLNGASMLKEQALKAWSIWNE